MKITTLLEYDGSNIPILIGKGMAASSKLSIGDTFIVRWMDKNRTYDANQGEIIHIMDTDNFKIDMGHIWIPLPIVQNMLSMDNQSTYVVYNGGIQNINDRSDWIKRDVNYLIKDIVNNIQVIKKNRYV